ncbi:MAG: adenylosuccinate synthetase [Oscillospiraceae bacterium]|nr:adenylosuccinate synthetase [Oscillospiraceae bacterium]
MSVTIIIGKNFGDEGKGLAADYFASRSARANASVICIRHNGGAQAGHTVDLPGRRFVFSQLSSASFRSADTYWADSFLPDLYKLSDEAERFRALAGSVPQIYASPDCRCTYIGDILLNMLLETARGKNRHGSCGMGINEAVVRSEKYPLRLGDIAGQDAAMLYERLRILQRDYLPQRISELQIDLHNAGEYGELLQSDTVLRNAAETMARNTEYLELREPLFLCEYDDMLFEGAQGLLLDEFYTAFAPHLTTSRTGLTEPARILHSLYGDSFPQTEIVYITRSYVTRHGAGPLPHADPSDPNPYSKQDRTNIRNEWQGSLRSAPHGNPAEFAEAVRADLSAAQIPAAVSLFVTHLNESDGCFITSSGRIPVNDFCAAEALRGLFSKLYFSETPFAENVRISNLI